MMLDTRPAAGRSFPLFEAHPILGLVFSLKDVEAESPAESAAAEGRAKHLRPHELLGELSEVTAAETW
jgi:hypothetical protein